MKGKALGMKLWPAALVGALAVGMTATGCGGDEEKDQPEEPPAPAPETQPEEGPGTQPPEGADEARTIPVRMVESAFEMPSQIQPGPVVFEIANDGMLQHSFAINGEGIEKQLDEPLDPGQTGTLRVDLVPGEYYVWCPVGRHEARGMKRTIMVQR